MEIGEIRLVAIICRDNLSGTFDGKDNFIRSCRNDPPFRVADRNIYIRHIFTIGYD